jgi:hypothetical protein
MAAKPTYLQKAICANDKKVLSAAGRAGARARQTNRDIEKFLDELRESREYALRMEANEHIIPLSTYDD